MSCFIKYENELYYVINDNNVLATFKVESDAHKFIQSINAQATNSSYMNNKYYKKKFYDINLNQSSEHRNYTQRENEQKQTSKSDYNNESERNFYDNQKNSNNSKNNIDENYVRRIVAEMQRDVLLKQSLTVQKNLEPYYINDYNDNYYQYVKRRRREARNRYIQDQDDYYDERLTPRKHYNLEYKSRAPKNLINERVEANPNPIEYDFRDYLIDRNYKNNNSELKNFEEQVISQKTKKLTLDDDNKMNFNENNISQQSKKLEKPQQIDQNRQTEKYSETNRLEQTIDNNQAKIDLYDNTNDLNTTNYIDKDSYKKVLKEKTINNTNDLLDPNYQEDLSYIENIKNNTANKTKQNINYKNYDDTSQVDFANFSPLPEYSGENWKTNPEIFEEQMLFGGIMQFKNTTDDKSLGEISAFAKTNHVKFYNDQNTIQPQIIEKTTTTTTTFNDKNTLNDHSQTSQTLENNYKDIMTQKIVPEETEVIKTQIIKTQPHFLTQPPKSNLIDLGPIEEETYDTINIKEDKKDNEEKLSKSEMKALIKARKKDGKARKKLQKESAI